MNTNKDINQRLREKYEKYQNIESDLTSEKKKSKIDYLVPTIVAIGGAFVALSRYAAPWYGWLMVAVTTVAVTLVFTKHHKNE